MNPAEPNHLRAWREAAGLTQAQVEKILGWQPARVSHLEVGKAVITDKVLEELAPRYGCTPADLLRGPPPFAGMRAKTRDAVGLVLEAERALRKLREDYHILRTGLAPRLEELESQINALNTATTELYTTIGDTSALLTEAAAFLTSGGAKKRRKRAGRRSADSPTAPGRTPR